MGAPARTSILAVHRALGSWVCSGVDGAICPKVFYFDALKTEQNKYLHRKNNPKDKTDYELCLKLPSYIYSITSLFSKTLLPPLRGFRPAE